MKLIDICISCIRLVSSSDVTISNLDIVTIEDDPNMIYEIKVSLTFIVTKTNSEQTITIFAGQDGIVRIE